jgi:hypothetical protein
MRTMSNRRQAAPGAAALSAALAALALLVAPARAQLVTHVIAVKGRSAPGGGTFDSFVRWPSINDAGQVAFTASLTGAPGGAVANAAIFRGGVGGLVQIAREGQLAPDANGSYADFLTSSVNPLINDAGQVAFAASLAGTTGGTLDDTGLYRSSGGGVTQVARAGQPAPGGNGTLGDLPASAATNDAGQLAFVAGYVGTAGGVSDNSGIVRGDGGALVEIVRAGQDAPGGGRYSGFGSLAFNDNGLVAFSASVVGGPNGFFFGGPAGVTSIARRGQAAPGGGFVGSGSVAAFNLVDQALLHASVSAVSNGPSESDAIFRGNGGELVQIVRTGQAAPDGNGAFSTLGNVMALNLLGQAAFTATTTGAQNNGLFRGDGLALTQIARDGQAAPGGVGVFDLFAAASLNDVGQVAFVGFLKGAGVTAANDVGVYLHDDDLGLVTIAREGDELLGSTIIGLGLAGNSTGGPSNVDGRSGLNNLGQVAYDFTLADGRRGIALGSLIDSAFASIDADFDNDDDVDGADFLVWQRGLGLSGDSATNAAGNADADDDVDSADLGAWGTRFGGLQSTGAVQAIPEPAAAMLAALMFWGLHPLLRRRTDA